jgi:hypothetical protein
MLRLEKEKYLKILADQGASAAITALHHDTEKMEQYTFEGQEGYDPKNVEFLEGVREFSRELWLKSIST